MYYGNSGFNVYAFIILVLIVLQWTLTPTTGTNNLTNNGGLFIIALFGLILCSCASHLTYPNVYYRRRRLFY